jgi:ketosteroid isomerase-like protein
VVLYGAVSSDAIAVVREFLEALGRVDVDAAAKQFHEDGEWYPEAAGLVEGGGYRGPDGIRQYVADMRQVMESVAVEIQDVRNLGTRTVAVGNVRATGLGSGVQVEEELGIVFEVESGRIRSGRSFRNREAALAAASRDEDGGTHGS